MSYDEAKTKLIQLILDDPAGFLTEQLSERQPFYNTALTAFDAEENPTILRLQEGNDIYLTVTSWDYGNKSMRRTEVQAHTVEPEEWDNIAWGQPHVTTCGPILSEDPFYMLDRAMRGDSLAYFQYLIRKFDLKNPLLDCVWFFPLGTRLVRDIPSLMMYATNRDRYKWHPPVRLSTFQTGVVGE